MVEEVDGSPPKSVREAFREAENVTGAEFNAPSDLDGYLDEPNMVFGIWVGDDADDAELKTFQLTVDQIEQFAVVFQRAADDAVELGGEIEQ
jgi:hypothetical protein